MLFQVIFITILLWENRYIHSTRIKQLDPHFLWGHLSGLGWGVVDFPGRKYSTEGNALSSFSWAIRFPRGYFQQLKAESEWREPHPLMLEAASTFHQSFDFWKFFGFDDHLPAGKGWRWETKKKKEKDFDLRTQVILDFKHHMWAFPGT